MGSRSIRPGRLSVRPAGPALGGVCDRGESARGGERQTFPRSRGHRAPYQEVRDDRLGHRARSSDASEGWGWNPVLLRSRSTDCYSLALLADPTPRLLPDATSFAAMPTADEMDRMIEELGLDLGSDP